MLLLFPMHWNGSLSYARKRAIGTVLGVVYGIGCQIILYDWFNVLILVIPLLWIGTMLFAKAHLKEAGGIRRRIWCHGNVGHLIRAISKSHPRLYV